MLDALERRGFGAVAPAADDRRRRVVTLTAEGERVARSWNAACREEAAAMLQGFTPAERDAFADYLVRAHQNLRAYGRKLAQDAAVAAHPADAPAGDPAAQAPAPAPAQEVPHA